MARSSWWRSVVNGFSPGQTLLDDLQPGIVAVRMNGDEAAARRQARASGAITLRALNSTERARAIGLRGDDEVVVARVTPRRGRN